MPQPLVELPNPFPGDSGTILVPAPPGSDPADLIARVNAGKLPFVLDDGTHRHLHFSFAYVQSSMLLKDPDALAIDYTRAMMAFLLFAPRPRRLLLLGLGGGSLVKFCHRRLAGAALTVVEIDRDVIALRDAFGVPPDDGRLEIRCEDAAAFLAERPARLADDGVPARFEAILSDAFDPQGLAASVSRERFYRDAHDALAGRGVLVVNLAGERELRADQVALMDEVFDERVLVLPTPDGGNHVAFAMRDPAFSPDWRRLTTQAKVLQARLGLDFPQFVRRLQRGRRANAP